MTDEYTPIEQTIYDGQGNPVKVANAPDDEGRMAQGTGATMDEALDDASKPGNLTGEGFNKDPER